MRVVAKRDLLSMCALVFLHSCSLVVKEPKIFDTTLCCSVPPTLKKKGLRGAGEGIVVSAGVLDFCAKCVPFSCKASLLSFSVFL